MKAMNEAEATVMVMTRQTQYMTAEGATENVLAS